MGERAVMKCEDGYETLVGRIENVRSACLEEDEDGSVRLVVKSVDKEDKP